MASWVPEGVDGGAVAAAVPVWWEPSQHLQQAPGLLLQAQAIAAEDAAGSRNGSTAVPVPWQLLRPVSTPVEAAAKIQRWYRSRARRHRFLGMIRRAIGRRKYLDERRRVARRIQANEVQTREMKVRMSQPDGVLLVGQWREACETEAAQRIQSLWHSALEKKELERKATEQQREAAARKLQAFVRRLRRRGRPSPLSLTAEANPWRRAVESDRLSCHKDEVLRKRRQYTAAMLKGKSLEEVRQRAEVQYAAFGRIAPRARYDVWRTLLQREQTRQVIQALEGRNWGNPVPYGVCSAALLRDAEDKHLERKASMEQAMHLGGLSLAARPGEMPLAVESRTEEEEAQMLLRGLETELGYDFSFIDTST